MRVTIATAAALILASTSVGLACGEERWPVKTGTDQDAVQVALVATATTVEALRAIPAPPSPDSRPNSRFAPTETGEVAVSAILRVIKREKDQDYHLVIADPETGGTMIVEAPNPSCAAGSRFAGQIAEVRQTLDDYFHGPIRRRMVVEIPVTVTGVPFFDVLHGQEGVAPNGIELHPMLGLQLE